MFLYTDQNFMFMEFSILQIALQWLKLNYKKLILISIKRFTDKREEILILKFPTPKVCGIYSIENFTWYEKFMEK